MGGRNKFYPVAEMVPVQGELGQTGREPFYEGEAVALWTGDPEERVDRLPMPYDAINYVMNTSILERVFDVVDAREKEREGEARMRPRMDLGPLRVDAASGVPLPPGKDPAAADKKSKKKDPKKDPKKAVSPSGTPPPPIPGVRVTAAVACPSAGVAVLGRDDGCVALVDAVSGVSLGEVEGDVCGLGAGPVRCLASVSFEVPEANAAGAARASIVAAASEAGVALFAVDTFVPSAEGEVAAKPELRVVATSPAALGGCGLLPLEAEGMEEANTGADLRQRPSDLVLSADGAFLCVSGRDTAQFCVFAVPPLDAPAGPSTAGGGKESRKGSSAGVFPQLSVVVAPSARETEELKVAWPVGFKTRVGAHYLPSPTSRPRAVAIWWEGLNRVQLWPLPPQPSEDEGGGSGPSAVTRPETDLVLPDLVTCVASSAGPGHLLAIGFAGATVATLDMSVGHLGLRPLGLRPRERPGARLSCLAFSSDPESKRIIYSLTDGTGGVADLDARTTSAVPGSPALKAGVHVVSAVRFDAHGFLLLGRNDRSVEVVSLGSLRSVGVLRADEDEAVGSGGLVSWRHALTPQPPVEEDVVDPEPEPESFTLSLSVCPADALAAACAEAEAEAGPSPSATTEVDPDEARLSAGVDALREERMTRGMAMLAKLLPTAPSNTPFRPMGMADRWGGEGWDLWASAS